MNGFGLHKDVRVFLYKDREWALVYYNFNGPGSGHAYAHRCRGHLPHWNSTFRNAGECAYCYSPIPSKLIVMRKLVEL